MGMWLITKDCFDAGTIMYVYVYIYVFMYVYV